MWGCLHKCVIQHFAYVENRKEWSQIQPNEIYSSSAEQFWHCASSVMLAVIIWQCCLIVWNAFSWLKAFQSMGFRKFHVLWRVSFIWLFGKEMHVLYWEIFEMVFLFFLIITLVRHDSFILWEEPCKGASVTALTTTRHMRCCCCGFPRIVTQWEGIALLKINRRTFYHVITQHFLVLGNYVIELLQKYLTIGLLIWKQTFILSFLWQNNSAVLQHLATKHQRVREEGERWLP